MKDNEKVVMVKGATDTYVVQALAILNAQDVFREGGRFEARNALFSKSLIIVAVAKDKVNPATFATAAEAFLYGISCETRLPLPA